MQGIRDAKAEASSCPPGLPAWAATHFQWALLPSSKSTRAGYSSSGKTPVMKKIKLAGRGRSLQHSGGVCPRGKKRNMERERGKIPGESSVILMEGLCLQRLGLQSCNGCESPTPAGCCHPHSCQPLLQALSLFSRCLCEHWQGLASCRAGLIS